LFKRMDFKAIYNRDNFIEFFRDKLLPEDFNQQTEIIEPDFKSNYYQAITFLGNTPSLDLNVYEIKHSSEKDARVGLSRDAFKLISRFSENNALVLFVPENPTNFRLSLVTIDPKLDAKGVKILKEYSNPRRYSFVLGEDAKTHTPEQYLIGLGRISNADDLKKRFSVEVVNKEFYGQIAEMFSKLVGGKRKKGNRTVEYQRTLELPSVSAENDQKYKEFAVRLIGRTVFCWFLKKKKSDNNIPLIDNDVLSGFAADFTPNFYHARVEPLFFEILNTAVEKRKPEYKKTPFDTIPFLNGGLFEPHTDDYYVKGTPNYALKIPDEWWKEFLEILETYNFTIDENTSIDIDLSVDPEMLGRIFENLLAEINPETRESARKSTGSYYTPRDIVEYMVDQSIKQYLSKKTNIEEEKFDILLNYSDASSGLTITEEKQVLMAINAVKVLDPACGSGAFPMGMLQKLLLVLQKVDNEAESSVRQILNDIADPVKRDLIKRKLEAAQVIDDKDFDDYARKLSVIQRSIYGVDIQTIAADISRLRFFLSLVVDEVIQDEMPNRGIEPLPNLEFKFVCANTLIPLPKPDSFEKMFGDSEIVQELEEIRTKYFTASNEDKPVLKRQFEDLQKKLYLFISKNKDILSNPNSQLALLSAWKPFSDEASTWFDAKWMFGVNDGFDIVIGNPPWGAVLTKDEKKHLKNIYPEIDSSTPNSFSYFIGFGNRIKNFVLTFVLPDSILIKDYEKTRKLILESLKICNWYQNTSMPDKLKPFVYVTHDVCVIVSTSDTYSDLSSTLFVYDVLSDSKQKITKNINKKSIITKDFNYTYNLSVQDVDLSILNKLQQFSAINNFLQCHEGIHTGNSRDILFHDSKINKYCKPLFYGGRAGDSINSYFSVTSGWWVDYRSDIIDKSAGQYASLRDEKIFYKPKIYISRTGNPFKAFFDIDNYASNNFFSLQFLDYNENNEFNLKYILAFINSKIALYFIRKFAAPRLGATFVETKILHLLKLPVPKSTKENKEIIVELVNKIIESRKREFDSTKIEIILNVIISKLYKLSFNEYKIVDPAIEKIISQKDYELLDIEGLSKYEIK
ncbi:MAG: Eco57I restriction-modification methylase domain-containing protein, partial [Bacteroidota bacterium]